ncbi:MAG: hypothetical protein CM1200mP38_4470 [Dehalococcoidia bacterium]|nr:MAG: hypothetical protein CM1200mP38_4470 [Dehalococcoidia bacterium]
MLKFYIKKSFKSVYLGFLGLALVLSVGLSGSIVEASTLFQKYLILMIKYFSNKMVVWIRV